MLLLCFGAVPRSVAAPPTAFAYTGQLVDSARPANGYYELQFRLADAADGGNYVGPTLDLAPVWVSNGQFTVALDFGAAAFDGSARWLEVAVRTSGGAINAMPYAIFVGGSKSCSGEIKCNAKAK